MSIVIAVGVVIIVACLIVSWRTGPWGRRGHGSRRRASQWRRL